MGGIRPESARPAPRGELGHNRDVLLPFTRLSLSAFMLYGIGYVVPLLRRDLDINDATAGLHASGIAIGTIIAGLSADRVSRRIGISVVAALATVLVAASSLIIALAPNVTLTLAGTTLMGIGGGTILAWVNHSLSALGGHRARVAVARANLIGLLAGLASPLAIAAVESVGANGRLALILPVPIVAIVELIQRRRGIRVEAVVELATAPATEGDGRPTHRRLPAAYWRTWLVMVLGISLEFGVVFWGASLIGLNTAASTSEATTAAAAFLVGMLAARLALSAGIGTRASRLRLLPGALTAVIVGALIAWQADSVAIAALGLFICGIGVGPLYPVTVAFALSLVPDNANAGAVRATLGTGVALTSVPFLLAVTAEQIGLVAAWPLIAVIALVAIGLVLVTRADAPPATAPPATAPPATA
jgi:MFS family permease